MTLDKDKLLKWINASRKRYGDSPTIAEAVDYWRIDAKVYTHFLEKFRKKES